MTITLNAVSPATIQLPTSEPLLREALQSRDHPSNASWWNKLRAYVLRRFSHNDDSPNSTNLSSTLNPFQNLKSLSKYHSSNRTPLFYFVLFITGAGTGVFALLLWEYAKKRRNHNVRTTQPPLASDAPQDETRIQVVQSWIWRQYAQMVRSWHSLRQGLTSRQRFSDVPPLTEEEIRANTRQNARQTTNPIFEHSRKSGKSLSVAFVMPNIVSHLAFIKELHETSLREVTLYIISMVSSDEQQEAQRTSIEEYFSTYERRGDILNRVLFCETDKGVMAMLRQIEPRYIVISKNYENVVHEVARLMRRSQFVMLPREDDEDEIYKQVDARRQVIFASELQDVLPMMLL